MGTRLGAGMPKALVQVGGEPLITHAVRRARATAGLEQLVVVVPAGHRAVFEALDLAAELVDGGAERTDSVAAGLTALHPKIGVVLVHDAARAFAPTSLFDDVAKAVRNGADAVVPGLPVIDTIKQVAPDGRVAATPDRAGLRAVQTPQGFRRSALDAAHAQSRQATDDAALVEQDGGHVIVIDGHPDALKVTVPADLDLAAALATTNSKESPVPLQLTVPRTGIGVDVHAYADDDRVLSLACLTWPGEGGIDGHSDGDVAAHAVCDALLAAAGLGDLGTQFGVDRPQMKGATGTDMLKDVLNTLQTNGFRIGNVSVQIVGNRPKVGPRREEAQRAMSAALGGAPVSVSATTTDHLGFLGRGEGIGAVANALVVAAD
ncbi:2-C-methyl-D-erythritol 2,4-cyclodiphosphate synthase [Yimella sp. cx-573]|nr:2-C-methyl-D-erythritol 2,4-cyclodiphosphate synthase [Yimella sp. cx-573]